MPSVQRQLGTIINKISSTLAELAALEAQARNMAVEASETSRELQAIQRELIERFVRDGDLHKTEISAGQQIVDDAHMEQHQTDT